MWHRRSVGQGVIAVLTGGDAAAEGLKPIPHRPVPTNQHEVPLRDRDGSGFFIAPHPVLARDTVRYVGEPVAIVIAGGKPPSFATVSVP